MKRFWLVLALVIGMAVLSACSEEKEQPKENLQNPTVLTVEERKDIFVSYFNHSQQYSAEDISRNLDTVDNPQILTLDEALTVFWKESGYSPKDFLQKTDDSGQVYYQHKTNGNRVSVFVKLLYSPVEEGGETPSAKDYGFIVVQTSGQNYFININGQISSTE